MSNEVEIKELAAMLKALGEPSRLKIFQFLAACCNPLAVDDQANISPVNGVTVGEVCCRITGENNITSTMSHHLKELRIAGLINMERSGKNMICSINKDKVLALSKVLNKIISPCCGGTQK